MEFLVLKLGNRDEVYRLIVETRFIFYAQN